MTLFELLALLVSITAVFGYINHHLLKLPTAVGVMAIAVVVSLAFVGLGYAGIALEHYARSILERVDFDRFLLHGLLSFLLFAGALHVDLNRLANQKWIITSLASFGVVTVTVLVGLIAWLAFRLVGVPLELVYCLLFGALIAPTDPVAVLGILKKAGVPQSLETKITGESLFNDGIAVVVFLAILELATGHAPGAGDIVWLLIQEAGGGALLGAAAGYVAYRMLETVDSYEIEILITLALVSGGYALAQALHLSGPIAVVVAGLLIGNHGRSFAMSERTEEHLDTFWELIDEILNAVLFVLIGMEVLVITLDGSHLLAGVLMIPAVLAARLISVAIPVVALRRIRAFSPGVISILTWGGLRGGISVALALSLPPGPERDTIVTATYAVVLFSILVQGLTIDRLVQVHTQRGQGSSD